MVVVLAVVVVVNGRNVGMLMETNSFLNIYCSVPGLPGPIGSEKALFTISSSPKPKNPSTTGQQVPTILRAMHIRNHTNRHVSMIVLERTVCDLKVSQCLFSFDRALRINCAARCENQKVQFQLLTLKLSSSAWF